MAENILQNIVIEFRELLDPIAKASGDEGVRREILTALNLDPNQASQPINIPPSALSSIESYTQSASEDIDLEAFVSVVQDIQKIVQAFKGFIDAAGAASAGAPLGTTLNEVVTAFLNMTTLGYLRVRNPGVYIGLKVFGLLNEQAVHYGGLFNFFVKMEDHFKEFYVDSWSLETEAHAQKLSDGILFILGVIASAFVKADILYGWDSGQDSIIPDEDIPLSNKISNRTLTILLKGEADDISGNTLGASLIASFLLLPKNHQGPGLIIRLKGSGSLNIPLKQVFIFGMSTDFKNDLDSKDLSSGIRQVFKDNNIELSNIATIKFSETSENWLIVDDTQKLTFKVKNENSLLNVYINELSVKISVDGPDPIIYLGKENDSFPAGTDTSIGVSLNHKSAGDFSAILGSPKATHLVFGESTLEGFISTKDYSIKAGTKKSSLTISGGDSDGFINSILPSGKVKVDFTFGIGFSKKRGFFIEGGAGLLVAIPIHKDVGPLSLQTLTLGMKVGEASESSALNIESSLSFSLKLGGLTATIDRIGLTADFDFPEGGGNLGPLNLDIGFKPPTSIGLSIKGGGFKGGGFLGFEPEEKRYTGFLELTFKDKISLKAIGLLTTQLPNGQDGYSLLIIITAEFSPVQLGFGFTLNGIGGLLGLNRTMNLDRLQAGIRNNTLSSILFPQNIVANANQIISDLRQVFPPQDDRFVFGPMFKIGWGSPTIITIDMGIMIEVPSPVRLAILGVIKASLPDEKANILKLQVNFLGVIDFEKKQLSFDASLYDSKLLAYTLTGDMAIRLYWGEEANFLMTVGGFHPAYEPPPMNLPDIRRLTLALLDGDNPRLRMESYYAVTSNTVQFGSKTKLYVAAWKINVYGFISYDVLFQFSPFRFIADVSAMLAIRYGNTSFGSIKLAFSLEGPTPWKAKGTASFKICWFFTVKVRFNKTFGENINTNLSTVEVLPALLEAFNNKDNWNGELPGRRNQLVSFKEIEALLPEEVLAHPVGVLVVSQKLVPLNITIQKFGYQKPADATEFHIENVLLETKSTQPGIAKEDFAPAQFFEYKDEEKLSLPSFKSFDSGIRIADLDKLNTDYVAAKNVKYELKYIDSVRNRRLEIADNMHTLDAASFNTWAMHGAIAQSDLSFDKNKKPVLAPQEVGIAEESFGIVNTSDLKLFDNNSLVTNEIEAMLRRDLLIAENPALSKDLQVVPAFEIME